jgi:hypothetical protein
LLTFCWLFADFLLTFRWLFAGAFTSYLCVCNMRKSPSSLTKKTRTPSQWRSHFLLLVIYFSS